MKANLGKTDRAIRITILMLILTLVIVGIITGIKALIGVILAILLIVTSAIGYCPIYHIWNINTKQKLNDKAYRSQNHFY